MGVDLVKIERALISVSDKSRLDLLARKLQSLGVEIISTGGTEKYLKSIGVKVTSIAEITNNPEAFAGRMKSLSFQISSGLLFQRDKNDDVEDAKKLGVKKIDLVICNFYPFDKQCNFVDELDQLVGLIDVGGPTMIRSGAKNFKWVAAVTNVGQYEELINELDEHCGNTSEKLRTKFALEAFRLLGSYDSLIHFELSNRLDNKLALRYGENPHQRGFVVAHEKGMLASIVPLQGKQLSYNNYLDIDAAINVARDLNKLNIEKRGVVIIKHQNPCGVALSDISLKALKLAWSGDSVSSFGSVVAFTKEVEADVATWLNERFVEVVIAPKFTKSALEIFSVKKNLRVIEYDFINVVSNSLELRSIDGGVVIQDKDIVLENSFRLVTKKQFPLNLYELARFAILTAKHLKSNAISLVREIDNSVQLIGSGMGNPNRVVSIDQAIAKAKESGFVDFSQVVLASDAFFPFTDNVELIGRNGISYIVQPGGSLKDQDVIFECDKKGIAMVFTDTRHFKH